MKAVIESHEGGIYLAKCSIYDNEAVKDICRSNNANHYINDKQKPRIFRALSEARAYLSDHHFNEVWLYQHSPYDEMIGLESSPQSCLIRLV